MIYIHSVIHMSTFSHWNVYSQSLKCLHSVMKCIHSVISFTCHTWHDSLINNTTYRYETHTHSHTQLIHTRHGSFMCAMTRSYVCHDSFVYNTTYSSLTQLIRVCHGSFICAMTHSSMTQLIDLWHNLFFCGKWPMKIRHPMTLRHPVYDIPHSYTWHDSFVRGMTHL